MNRAIGIDINKKYISLVQLCYKGGRFFFEKNHIQDISKSISSTEISPDEIRAVIKEIVAKENVNSKVPAIISIPFGRVFFHNYRTEFSTDKNLERLIKFELEDDFPIPFEDLVTEIFGSRDLKDHEREFLVGAVNRSKLRDLTHIISESGLNCSIVTSDACALSSLATLKNKQNWKGSSIFIYVDDCRIITAAHQNGSLIFARHIENIVPRDMNAVLKQETALTMRNISDIASPLPLKIILCGSSEPVHDLYDELSKDDGCEIEIANPFAGIYSPSHQEDDNRLVIASGLALIGMDNKSQIPNFLATDKAGTEEKTKTKRNTIALASLLLALVAMFIITLFDELRSLENENQSLEQQVRQIFVQTFPDEKKIVNELAQMNEKYNVLEQEYQAIASEISDQSPILEIIDKVSEKITPDQNVRISSISMTPESVQLNANAADFESVDKLVEKLKQISLLSSIDIKNLEVDPANNWVRFNLLIKISIN